jgi:tetratricopeptide (TPR) repeat protein
MGMFNRSESDINAIKAAISVQEEFKKLNSKEELKGLDAIQTKIGICSGDFYLLPYIKEGDPQGTSVDTAFRITDLAKSDQIICSENCKENCPDEIRFGETVYREFKGILGKVGICEVIWQDELKIEETVHVPQQNDQIESYLQDAKTAEEEDNYDLQIKRYKDVLNLDPLHFIANLKLASTIHKHLDKLVKEGYKLEDALTYVEKAKESNPFSGDAKLLYTTLLWFLNHENLSKELIEKLIQETEGAMGVFDEELKINESYESKNSLAFFYKELFEEIHDEKLLDKGIDLCEKIEEHYDWVYYEDYPSFCDTHGTLLMKRNRGDDLKKARKLLESADKLAKAGNRKYIIQHINKHLYELAKIELRPPS